jgi:hypothetical protein
MMQPINELTTTSFFLLRTSQLTQNPEGVIVYEAQANPADHKVKGTAGMGSSGLGF